MPGLPIPLGVELDLAGYAPVRQQRGLEAEGSAGADTTLERIAPSENTATGTDGATDATGDEGNRYG